MPWLICGTIPDPNIGLLYGQASVRLKAGSALRLDAAKVSGNVVDNVVEGACDALEDVLLLHQPDDFAYIAATANTKADSRTSMAQNATTQNSSDADTRAGSRVSAVPINRGTAALAAAAALVCAELGVEAPYVLVAGDNGKGEGSRLVYDYLLRQAKNYAGWGITFHYLLPDVDWHNRLLIALGELSPRPLLCADAGFMYAAKMSGYAAEYDLFTPDAGELAFLADEKAPHPFYTRGFLLSDESQAPQLAARAFEHENSARTLLIKGRIDYIVQEGKVLASIDYPMVPNLEPIGGTGDTVAGTVSALLSAGYPMQRSCQLAALANRFMGQLAQPTPATQISELLAQLPGALQFAMQE